MGRVAAFAAALLAAMRVAAAHGVDDPPVAEAPLFDAEGAVVGAGTNYGLVLREGDRWLWTPEETLGDPELARLDWLRLAGGGVLLATSGGLWRTDDGGCSYRRVAGFGDRAVTALAADRNVAGLIYAGTEGGDGENGVFVSSDAGASWRPTALSGDLQIDGVVASDGRVWAAGLDRAAGAHRLWTSEDGGDSWRAAATGEWLALRPVDVGGAGVLLVGERADGLSWATVIADRALSTFEPAAPSGVELIDGAFDEAGRAVGLAATEELVGAGEGGAAPLSCLAPSASGEVWGCARIDTSEANLVRLGGDPAIPFAAIEPRACPADTPGAALVGELWPVVQRLGIGEPPPPPAGDSGGCVAAPGGASGGRWIAALLVGLAAWATRRRGRKRGRAGRIRTGTSLDRGF